MFSNNSISARTKTSFVQWKSIALILFGIPFAVLAQKPLDTRAQRDAEVVRTVLMEYFKEANPDKKLYRVATQKAEVQYFNGFGLLITAPTYVPATGRWSVAGNSFSYSIHTNRTDCDCDEETEEEETAKGADVKWPENEQITAVMKGFLVNYGSLMSFIQPGERMVLFYDKKNEWIGESWVKKEVNSSEKMPKPERLLVELQQESTRLSGPELAAKAKFTVVPLEKSTKPEFEIMGKIFNSTFDNATSNTFVSSQGDMVFFDGVDKGASRARYELFKGLGVIYNFSVNYNKALRMSYSFAPRKVVRIEGNVVTEDIYGSEEIYEPEDGVKGKGRIKPKPAKAPKAASAAKASKETDKEKTKLAKDNDKEKTKEISEKKVAEEYEIFLKEVKNYMIEYGRTLRSLEPTERLIVNISINAWSNETLPKKIELSVLKSVLDEYEKRTLSLEEAAAKIVLREYTKDTRNASTIWFNQEE